MVWSMLRQGNDLILHLCSFMAFPATDSLELIKDVKAAGGTTIAEKYVVTDHSWSDHRIALESLVINWLETLPGPR